MAWIRIAVVATVLVLAGCSDDEAASPSTSAPVATGAPDVPDDPFCAPAEALGEGFDEIAPGGDNTDALREQFAQAREAIEQAQAEAPAEVQDDIAVLAAGYEEFISALEAVDYDFEQISLSALTALDTPEMEAASQRLDAYRSEVCAET